MIMRILVVIGICILSYFLGCFSTARVLAKSFKHLNVYKIGSGLADITNIYNNISKTLGIFAGILDIAKMFVYIKILEYLFSIPFSQTGFSVFHFFTFNNLSNEILLFTFGFFLLAGHCLPITHGFKGGRGIFTYSGLMFVFIPYQMLGILIFAGLLVIFFRQFRFAQFMIVLLPPILCYFLGIESKLVTLMTFTAVLMGFLNFLVSKRLGEF